MTTLSDDELWLLSFYRTSEISGALFFGRLARSLRPGPIQRDLTKHFADESAHAWYWTECLERLETRPLKLDHAYQDRYLEAAGMPANLMEVLAITQVFERRVIGQYALHRRAPGLPAPVVATFERIMADETWHLRWVGDALAAMAPEYGQDAVDEALARCQRADREVHGEVLRELDGRLADLVRGGGRR